MVQKMNTARQTALRNPRSRACELCGSLTEKTKSGRVVLKLSELRVCWPEPPAYAANLALKHSCAAKCHVWNVDDRTAEPAILQHISIPTSFQLEQICE